ncbi:Small ribosomal subunit biogenesis GTPase RsgA [Halomonadaceae bacterium LMG 33818]|uniref:small ribosomal subunit biogenesis GTPase RsgA n=1 Tax=Cernens ardua TaxID=3402176 RepID=UPI003EDC867E
MSGRKLTRQQRRRIENIHAKRNQRATKGDTQSTEELDASSYGPEQPGRVVAHFGRTLEVEDSSGELHRCHLRANLDSLVSGDYVSWREGQDGSGIVVARHERESLLERPTFQGQLKPVAANLDRIMIVFAVEPAPFANLIDRYLVAAEATGIQPALVLNKIDLLQPDAEVITLLERYQQLGYDVVQASTETQHGLETLKASLTQHTSVFVGQSGVGKSSLIQALLPDHSLKIGALSPDSRKGTHTTTTTRLYHLPEGGHLIDSPGIREFGLEHLEEDQVIEGFVELRPFIGHCRFSNCRHSQEPGCAILEAYESGYISTARFTSFRQILSR